MGNHYARKKAFSWRCFRPISRGFSLKSFEKKEFGAGRSTEPECTRQSFMPGWGDGSHLVGILSPKNWESQLSTVSSNLLKSTSLKSRVRKRVSEKRLSVSEHLQTQPLLFFLIIKTASNEKILRVNLLILTEHAEVIVLPTVFFFKKKFLNSEPFPWW